MTSPPRRRGVGRPRDPAIDHALIQAALGELAAHGFTGMSIDRVSETTGIGKTTIYRRYPDKSALAVAALAALTTGEGAADSGDLVEDLARQLILANGNLEASGSVTLLGALLSERDRQPELIQTYRERLFRPRTDKIRSLLREARARGELRADLDLEAASLLLLGFLAASYIADAPLSAGRIREAVRGVVDGARA